MSFPCLIVHAGNDHRQQYCCQLLASSASSPSPLPLLLFFFFLSFFPHSTVTMLRSPRPQQQSWTWSGQPACSHLGHKSGWSQHTHTHIHSNCRPFPCPHVTACRSEALPHAATHKLGTVSSLQFIWWIVRYSYKDQLGLVFAFGSWGFVVFHDFRGCL